MNLKQLGIGCLGKVDRKRERSWKKCLFTATGGLNNLSKAEEGKYVYFHCVYIYIYSVLKIFKLITFNKWWIFDFCKI